MFYQLAFFTPGISPLCAYSLKQSRQNPNFLKYPLDLPQRRHLLRYLVLYLSFFVSLTIFDVFAMLPPFSLPAGKAGRQHKYFADIINLFGLP
ncbi:hypothetical protein A2714_00820 [Candidatus Woesebacteria bacterium RIFCSPHIGHO2_01_FULL_38_9]|uniref:Uncharacterized protein n=2 Tax=Candidatus Woeseibacteriota TaxID=1752722 RepID=A0A1F7Y3V4_9BACT|nr:MAG: hypothetical protein A2714_00820 [Candidatus Woesebacteria bacterium RIFCSPHIGHO2_01_FULL_38_9]OGM58635.1 MAG: hypothetical protein A3A75_01230 [Candidatus Woesebacteria bacterium RIFCSPLOWO2_01_FULL_39_10]